MTVRELIEFLKTRPQDLLVAYNKYSDYTTMDSEEIFIGELCNPRNDGWLERKRPDKPFQQYLIFPGN